MNPPEDPAQMEAAAAARPKPRVAGELDLDPQRKPLEARIATIEKILLEDASPVVALHASRSPRAVVGDPVWVRDPNEGAAPLAGTITFVHYNDLINVAAWGYEAQAHPLIHLTFTADPAKVDAALAAGLPVASPPGQRETPEDADGGTSSGSEPSK